MVSLSNGELADGSAKKRPLENGYHSSNSGNTPKYKSRKISAVRGFPPMCGQIAQSVKLEPRENGVVPVGDNVVVMGELNGVKTEGGIQNQVHEVLKSPVRMDANRIGTSTNGVQIENDFETQALEAMRSHVEMEIEKSRKPVNLEERENVVMSIGDSAVAALEASVVKFETEVEVQSPEVVGSPVGVEGTESLDKLVEKVVAGFTCHMDDGVKRMVSDANHVETELAKDFERKSMDVEHLKEVIGKEVEALAKELDKEESVPLVYSMGGDGVKPSIEIGHLLHKEVPVKDNAVPSPKNRHRRRRVSAVRDFPPYCGKSVPSVQESMKITSVENLLTVDQVTVEKGMIEVSKGGADGEEQKDGENSRAMKDILPAKVEMYSLENLGTNVEFSALADSVTVGGGLIEGDDRDGGFQERQAIGVVCLPENTSDAVICKDNQEGDGLVSKELIYADDNTGDRRGSDNDIGTGHDDNHMIVTALMAAPCCPWSQRKVASSSGGGITGGNINKEGSTWQAKSKAFAGVVESVTAGGEPTVIDAWDSGFQKTQARGVVSLPESISDPVTSMDNEKGESSVGKELVLFAHDSIGDRRVSGHDDDRVIVTALMAAPYCPWRQGKVASSSGGRITRGNINKERSTWLAKSKAAAALVQSATAGDESIEVDAQDGGIQESRGTGVVSQPENTYDAITSMDNEEGEGSVCKELVLFVHDNTGDSRPLDNDFGPGYDDDRVTVTALMAAPYCPWRQGKMASSSDAGIARGNINKDKSTWRAKSKAVAKKTVVKTESSRRLYHKMGAMSVRKDADGGTLGAVVVKDEGNSISQNEEPVYYSAAGSRVDVNLPPFGPSSSHGDARNRVRETLRLFQALCRKLLQGEESRSKEDTKSQQREKIKRIDLEAAKIIKERGKEVNTGKNYIGVVPGVEVGDEFQYRVELAIVGIHRLYQAGIDSTKHKGKLVATSIVASGAYDDDMENADTLTYSGQGGNIVGKDKQPEDQKLVKGNLALWNSISAKNPVRVIRGSKEAKASDSQNSRVKLVTSYIYDGLYTVEKCREETGTHGKLVFMFELKRIPGQPELAWKEVKKSKKSRVRYGVCVADISGGEELIPICAVNTIDSEKPQQFHYIRKVIYPDWFHLLPSEGCDCIGRCSDSRKCSCAQRNGGEIPYNRNGAIVEAKSLVYECGPQCKCPPSCYNRVSQHGIKVQLEIFKTESRGWGVRSLHSIPSGSFICEYVGELLEDKEAELRAGSDEYLFDIGQNYKDSSLNPNGQGSSIEAVEEGGYTIDAAKYGNVGRFINHSCSPNLYAQDVLYDHDDKKMPHVMLFAAENIPPLQELTYHYNYVVGQVHDSNGNVKMKSCYCGSTECTGRMY